MEFISDKEKRILLSAITREKKIIEKNQYNDLIPVIEHLEYLFRYDRLFKKIYNTALIDFIDYMEKNIEYARPVGWSKKIEIITMSTVRIIAENLKK